MTPAIRLYLERLHADEPCPTPNDCPAERVLARIEQEAQAMRPRRISLTEFVISWLVILAIVLIAGIWALNAWLEHYA